MGARYIYIYIERETEKHHLETIGPGAEGSPATPSPRTLSFSETERKEFGEGKVLQ